MDFYHTLPYEYFFNTTWFVWSIVIFILGGNILGPIILWFVMSGKEIPFLKRRKSKDKQTSS